MPTSFATLPTGAGLLELACGWTKILFQSRAQKVVPQAASNGRSSFKRASKVPGTSFCLPMSDGSTRRPVARRAPWPWRPKKMPRHASCAFALADVKSWRRSFRPCAASRGSSIPTRIRLPTSSSSIVRSVFATNTRRESWPMRYAKAWSAVADTFRSVWACIGPLGKPL